MLETLISAHKEVKGQLRVEFQIQNHVLQIHKEWITTLRQAVTYEYVQMIFDLCCRQALPQGN